MKEIIKTLETRLEGLKGQLAMSEGCLVSHNWILQVNDVYTVCLDSEGKTELSTKMYPSQFSDEGAKKIETSCTFINNKGETIKARSVPYKDYYRVKIQELEETIQMFKGN
jgi:hypothetical protein